MLPSHFQVIIISHFLNGSSYLSCDNYYQVASYCGGVNIVKQGRVDIVAMMSLSIKQESHGFLKGNSGKFSILRFVLNFIFYLCETDNFLNS